MKITISQDLLLVGGVDDVTLECSASINQDIVDTGELRYSFIWIYRDGSEVRNSSRTIITSSSTSNSSTLTLSPLSSLDTLFKCNVTVSESQNLLQRSNAGTTLIFINFNKKMFILFGSFY